MRFEVNCAKSHHCIISDGLYSAHAAIKEKIRRLFLLVKLAFLLNCICKILPCLCFPLQFDPVVSSLLVSDINRQQAVSDIPEGYMYMYE